MKKISSNDSGREQLTLLTVSSDSKDGLELESILDRESWNVVRVHTCSEAHTRVARKPPAVVVCDRNLPDGTWKDLLHLLSGTEGAPPMVVVSRHADEQLWAEVLNLGGYDVLAKPFEGTEVARVMTMALRHGTQRSSSLRAAS